MTRPTILIGFAEALCAPEVAFSLLNAGFHLRLFSRAANATRLARTLDIPQHEITPPEGDIDAARDDLLAICDGVDAVFALDDVSLRLFSDIAPRLGGLRQIHATGEQVATALDKEAQIAAARDAGLSVPDTLILHDPADLPVTHPLPAIAKPVDAVSVRNGKIDKGDVHYLMSAADIDAFRSGRLAGPVMVQPLIHGVGEGVFGHATAEGVTQWSGHRRLRMMNPHGSGSSACAVLEPAADLRASVERMMTGLTWRGPFMIELLRDQGGTPWFMELNGRVWGSMALARRNGFDYPAWAAESTFNAGFTPRRGPERRRSVRHLGRDLLHLLFLLRGPKTEFHRETWPRFSHSAPRVLRPEGAAGFYNTDPAHRLFFLGDALDTVASALRKRR